MTRKEAQGGKKTPLPSREDVKAAMAVLDRPQVEAARSILARSNGRKGGDALAAKYSEKTRKEWSARGGEAKGRNYAKKRRNKKAKK